MADQTLQQIHTSHPASTLTGAELLYLLQSGADAGALVSDILAYIRLNISEAIDDRVAALLVAGANVTLTYNDAAGTLTIAATGGGGSAVDSVNGQTGVVVLNASDVGAQPLDSDLTAIAALATTSFGRALLTLANAGATRTALGLVIGTDVQAPATTLAGYGITDAQPLDSDLTAIAALSTTSYGRALLALADAAAGRTALGLGALAVLSAVTASLISDASANGRSLITAADYDAMKVLLSLVIGTNVQAWDADLDAIAALTGTGVAQRTGANTWAVASLLAADIPNLAESKITNLVSDLAAKAPTARTLTINGVALDLSADRSWTVSGSADKLGLTPVALKTSNYTAAAGDFVPCDTSGGAFAVTLPTAPADGSVVAIKLVTAGNVLTLTLGGSDVFNKAGGSTTGSLTIANQGLLLQYKATGAIWYVVADDLSLSALDLRYTTAPTRTTFSNANYTILATDRYVAQIGTLSAPRTLTLPAANAVNAGQMLIIEDESNTVTATNTIIVARAGSDTINGGTSFTLAQAFRHIRLISDGTSKWFAELVFAPAIADFAASGSYVIPAQATHVRLIAIGSGSGGGSGRRGAAASARFGGGGGGGGGLTKAEYSVAEVGGAGTTITITVAAGGAGGAARTTDDTDGAAGGGGNNTSAAIGANTIIFAAGSGGGGAGTVSAGAAGSASSVTACEYVSGTGGGSSTSATGGSGNQGAIAAGGGAGGGGIDTGNTARAGGVGGLGARAQAFGVTAGGAGGAAGGTNGSAPSAQNYAPMAGNGGGGGGGNSAGAGGTGGAGVRGGGGGGGGASVNGSNSGAGGAGGDGFVRIEIW